MTEVKLFIATSIDGFIARENGSLDWLPGADGNVENLDPEMGDGGYGAFVEGVDVVVLGRNTYEEILGFGVDWPYANCTSYVATSDVNYKTSTENTHVINSLSDESILSLKNTAKKGVWLIGGGQLITHFLNLELIDEMSLSIISTVLGKGIRLFPNTPKEQGFQLVSTANYGKGMVNLTYRKAPVSN